MFGMSPLAMGFPGPEPDAVEAAGRQEEGTRVDRRHFVADTLGTAAGLTLGPSTAIGTPHITELREGLRSLYTLDDAYGGDAVRSLAIRHLRRIRRIINNGTYPDTIGRQLQLLAGETAEQCAWLFYDADDQEAARRYWGEALTAATVLGDDGLEILVLASLSMQAVHENRPRDGYDLARAAYHRAAPLGSPTLLSLIAAREARALARMRDHRAARGRSRSPCGWPIGRGGRHPSGRPSMGMQNLITHTAYSTPRRGTIGPPSPFCVLRSPIKTVRTAVIGLCTD
ncbi:hypothetical protein ACFQ2B_03710 [Streptomyces stramineus]